MQPEVDVEGVVEVGIVDESLPAHRGPRLLEVHAHDDEQFLGQGVGLFLQPTGVFARRFRVVNGARPDDNQQARIGSRDDVARLAAHVEH